jgi:hypothetical protein
MALVVGRVAERVGQRGAVLGLPDRRGEDASGEVIAAFRQGDRELAVGPSVELGRAAGAGTGPAGEPSELRLQEPLVAQPVQVELGGVHWYPDRGRGGFPPDGVRLGGYVLVKGATDGVGQCPDARGLCGEVHPVLSKRWIV